MARIVIPISLTFGGVMPWTLEGTLTSEWTQATVSAPYIDPGYIDPDYYDDEEWVVTANDDETWTLA